MNEQYNEAIEILNRIVSTLFGDELYNYTTLNGKLIYSLLNTINCSVKSDNKVIAICDFKLCKNLKESIGIDIIWYFEQLLYGKISASEFVSVLLDCLKMTMKFYEIFSEEAISRKIYYEKLSLTDAFSEDDVVEIKQLALTLEFINDISKKVKDSEYDEVFDLLYKD